MKTGRVLLSGACISKWAVILLAALVGFIFGTVADITIFLIVRPSLPPPWCWLPPLRDYSMGILSVAWYFSNTFALGAVQVCRLASDCGASVCGFLVSGFYKQDCCGSFGGA